MKWTDTASALQAAENFAKEAQAQGYALDYQPASITALEKYIILLRAANTHKLRSDPRGRQAAPVLDAATIYFLEVLRRTHTGNWILPEGELVVQLKQEKLSLRAEGLFASLLGRDGFQMSPVELFKEFSLQVTATLSEKMKREAEDARKLPGGSLFDYSPDSIEALEVTLLHLHSELRSRSKVGREIKENLSLLTRQLGAYLGETIIRQMGGRWVDGSADGGFYTLELPNRKGSCFPVGKVSKMLDNGAEDSVLAFFRTILKK